MLNRSSELHLVTLEGGSQILVDQTTGKRYAFIGQEQEMSGSSDQQYPRNNENYPDPNMHQQQIHQNYQSQQQTQPFTGYGSQYHYPNLMSISPNHSHLSHFTYNIQQGSQTRTSSQSAYQKENTSTPLPTRQNRIEPNQTIVIEERTQGIEQNETVNNYKRPLNESDEFITVLPKGQRIKNPRTERNQQPNEQPVLNANDIALNRAEFQHKYSVPMDQIQRAVVHNLPCFIISFSDLENLPSAVLAAEDLYEHFNRSGVKLNQEFSVVRYFGNQLKIGVKDKTDYQTLCNSEKWPRTLGDKQISVQVPRFTPEQFSLVVRFIPVEISIEQVESEVKRSATSASNFRKIVYSYPRKTIDYRFTVADLKEYNGLLRLGHIGIGNRIRTVTTYKPANKITYCSKCWKLGHLRGKCQEIIQKCRVCLSDYNETHNQLCSKKAKCAQCSLDHMSLDPDCQAVQQYRDNLNKAVKQAVQDGVVRVTSLSNKAAPPPAPKVSNTNYPSLPTPLATTTLSSANKWKNTQIPATTVQDKQDLTNHELLGQLKSFIETKFNRIDEQIKEIKKDVQENKKAIEKEQMKTNSLVAILKSTMEDVIKQIIKSVPNIDEKATQTLESLILVLDTQYPLTQINDQMKTSTSNMEEGMDQEQIQVQSQLN